ncbi:MAG: AAA family ATPase [Lentisphaeria bacterium]|jgi:predicted ATP-binding protein involved in virulence|nr:AAA family ATPase [Lentisphaeria bacterium]
MHIQKLKLERYRGARSLSISLHRNLNIFVGMNGAGKSSILDSAAILLSWLVNRIKSATASGKPILEADIMNGEFSANVILTLDIDSATYRWNIAKNRKNTPYKEASSDLSELSTLAKNIRSECLEPDQQAKLPLFVYYPVNRSVLDIPLRIRGKHRFDLLSAHEQAFSGGVNFRSFFEWFREREDLENEARRDQDALFHLNNTATYPDPQLEAVRKALSQFMPEFQNLTVRRSPLRMEVEKNGRTLTVNQLSDGEKCLMALIGDMARRLAIANPGHENPLEGKGIFLIDEIDLHLHPIWQQILVPRLNIVFPKCQFLITTHSPHVITHVPPENLFLLEMAKEGLILNEASESYGKTVERVLEDLMGMDTTRPKQVDHDIKEIFRQINDGNLQQAKQAIQALEKSIGADPELIRANILIKRKELIGK